MAHILIAAYGSRGDILPLTDGGCGPRDAEHEVVLTAPPDLVDDITRCGLQTRPVDFEIDADFDASKDDALKLAMQMVKPKGMRQLGGNLLAAVQDVPADLVLLTPFAELAGHPFAEARGIPSMGVRLQPMSTTADFPPTRGVVGRSPRQSRRLDLVRPPLPRRHGRHPEATRPAEALGTVAAPATHRRAVADPARLLPQRACPPTGLAPGLDVVDDDIITIGAVPHDWLFGKVAAGLPAVGVPSPGGDQPFWARRLERLGASAATLPRPKLNADELGAAIGAAVTDPAYRARAESLAAAIKPEHGARTVVAAVEERLRP